MSIEMKRTESGDADFITLVRELDVYLAEKDGDQHSFYDQYNKLDTIKHVIVAYDDGTPAGCGAIKEYAAGVMEVKRMYTRPVHRGKGIASMILEELENWARELGYSHCILETGKRQVEAVEFYRKNQYDVIPNYGQYEGIENSICYGKRL